MKLYRQNKTTSYNKNTHNSVLDSDLYQLRGFSRDTATL